MMAEDFDYVGMGGFLIECQDGELLGVTKEQAELVEKDCAFFQNCFRHGTVESQNGMIIKKPDWSLATARHLIQALTKGKTTLPTLELYEQLMAAGDQAVVDLRVCSLVNYMDPASKDHRFLELLDPSKYRFQFRANLKSDQWLELLDQGILLYRKETNFVVQVHKDQVLDREKTKARLKLDTHISDYLVHTDLTVSAILQMRQLMMKDQELPADPSERTSIYFETTESIPKDHHELIDRLAGGEAYIRTCADGSNCNTEGYTVMASFDVLARAIRPLKEKDNIGCSLRIDNPTPDTLGRFINACQAAKDYPATLGLDASTNRYFCKKSIRDILIILEYMADFSTQSRVRGDFQLYELSSEDQLF